jgi:hypothetical protein
MMAESPAVNESMTQSCTCAFNVSCGEQGLLTFEPYKSFLLPLWCFQTLNVAQSSPKSLCDQFIAYNKADDFMDGRDTELY